MERRRYDAVDVCKWLCAWLVVYIHLRPVLPGLPVADIFIAQGISRIAVPFFFAASSFLVFQKMDAGTACPKENRRILWRFCGRIALLYTLCALIYIGYKVFEKHYNNMPQENVLFYLEGYFFRGIHYHLWYLAATVYAAPVVYLLWRAGRGPLLTACVVCHVLQCLDQPYHLPMLFDQPAVVRFRADYVLISSTVLHAVPLMCLGVLCLADHKKHSSRQWRIRLLGMTVVFLGEFAGAYLVHGKSLEMDRPLSMVPLVYCLVNWLFTVDFRLPAKWMAKVLRLHSTWIYCAHPLVMLLYHWVFAYKGVVRFLAVGGVTFVTGCGFVAVKLLLGRRKANKSDVRKV